MKNSIKILALFIFVFFCFSLNSLAVLKPDFPDNSKLQKMPDGINADISQNIDLSGGENSVSEESNSNSENFQDRIQQEKNADNINYDQQEGVVDYHFNKYVVFFAVFTFFLIVSTFFMMREKKN